MTNPDRPAIAALSCLIVLQLIMLSALYAGVPPHPPSSIFLFGIAPFIGVAISAALAAIVMGPSSDLSGRTLSCLAVLFALISFGPQKYFDAQFPSIWPAVLAGQISAIIVIYRVYRTSGEQHLARPA